MTAPRVIDVAPLVARGSGRGGSSAQIDRACREEGFFYAVGHGVDARLCERLEGEARRFFARPLAETLALAMPRAGRAWRGYFPLGGELTSGLPDHKEGLYLGQELGPEDPRVAAGTPFFGANLFPPDAPELRAAVLDYLSALTALGHALMEGIALGLGLAPEHFARHLTGDPLVLLRLFRYPPLSAFGGPEWSVGEHTDYGLLTILHQDDAGGLEVRGPAGWSAVPPVPGSFVCNVGDMLERVTGGAYRSAPHRVRNASASERVSIALFFDPAFDARVEPLTTPRPEEAAGRWDGISVYSGGTYGEYLLAKVAKVFPDLFRGVV